MNHNQEIYAHRGGAGYFVENTLAAFAYGIELGADGAELDVHLTKDGKVVVHHNFKLNHHYCRKEDGSYITEQEEQLLSELTLAQLQSYTQGEPNPNTFDSHQWPQLQPCPEQRIPALQEVIQLAQEKSANFKLLIEIKTDLYINDEQSWQPLVDKVLEIIKDTRFVARTEFCSFDWRTLRYIKQHMPAIPLWFTTFPSSWLADGAVPAIDLKPSKAYLSKLRSAWKSGAAPWFAGFQPDDFSLLPEAVADAGGCGLFYYHSDITETVSEAARANNLKIAAWTSNLYDQDRLSMLGNVDMLCLDYPDIISGNLQ